MKGGKKAMLVNSIFVVFATFVILAVMYLIFNIKVFIFGTLIAIVCIPILYAILNAKVSSMRHFDYIICGAVSIIIVAFNQMIIRSQRFIQISRDLVNKDNMTIQDVNAITYVIGVFLSIAIYVLARKYLRKERI